MKVPAEYPRHLPSHMPTPIAFVGEAPGADEVLKGRPFVGQAGKTFDALLRTANLNRDDYFVGNVFDTKAPDNDVSPWMKDETIWKPALERLSNELAKARPSVIVPLGGTALWALAQTDQIMQHRGAVMPASRVMPGAKMVPTLHPSYLNHTWKMFSVVVGDLIKAASEAEKGPIIVYPERNLILEPTIEEVEAYAERLLSASLISVDIETARGQITCIGIGGSSDTAMCVPFVDIRRVNNSYWQTPAEEVRAWLAVKKVLESDVPKLGQNFAGYDWLWLLKKAGIGVRGLTHDTRLLHHALYPELPKSLQFMGSAYTNQGVWKTWGHAGQEKKDD